MKIVLDNIRSQYQSKVVIALIEDIEQHPDVQDLYTLKSLAFLSLFLFVLGDKKNALCLADIVSQLDLKKYAENVKGFADSASSAHYYEENALVLCTVLHKESGNLEKAEAYWQRYLVSRLETNAVGEPTNGNVARRRWKRNLEKGDLLDVYGEKRQSYIDTGDSGKAVRKSFDFLEELLWMKEAGGSELYPIERLAEMIDDTVKYIRDNIDNVDSSDFV